MRKQDNAFERFDAELTRIWTARSVEIGSLINRQNLFISREGSKVGIYRHTRMDQLAYFTPDRSWIDDTQLFQFLREELPDYVPFFRNEKPLNNERLWDDVGETKE